MVFDEYPICSHETSVSDFLFFKGSHLQLANTPVQTFILARNYSHQIIAEFHCNVDVAGCWISLLKAPFGGLTFHENCTNSELIFMLHSIKDWLARSSCKALIIKTPPSCYDLEIHEKTHWNYVNTGFSPYRTLTNHYIPVTQTKFSTIISSTAARRLRKSLNAGIAATLNTNIPFDQIYSFIYKCHTQKGYPLPVLHEELAKLTQTFPNHFLIFTASHKSVIVAVIIAVRVAPHVLYLFLSDYDHAYATFSPIILLTQCLYEHCQLEGCKILDLGTSLDHLGNPKESLSRFKRNLGAEECVKVTYRCEV